MIKVYLDRGVGRAALKSLFHELSSWEVAPISADEIINSPWEESTSLLIIPGGKDVEYHHALKGRGNQRIRDFVENGGSFLGICAGAYYGCESVEFDIGNPLEVLGERELKFFPGVAKGPAYGPQTYEYDSEIGSRASQLSNDLTNIPFRSYFNGGCYFDEAEKYPDIVVLSRYLDIPGEPAAIIEKQESKGMVILSGVHIEIGTITSKILMQDEIEKSLQEHEPKRHQFFNDTIERLLEKKIAAKNRQ